MKAAIYPGTFDPPTVGHLDIIQRAARQVDKLIIAIGENPAKKASFFTLEEKKQFLKAITQAIPSIEVTSFTGLLVDFAKSCHISLIIRSIRTFLDFENETLEAQMNRHLEGLETFYLGVNEKYRLISSSRVREIGSYGRTLTGLVPPEIEAAVFYKLSSSGNR